MNVEVTGQDAAADAEQATPTDADRLLAPGRRPLTIGLLLTVTAIAFEALAVATVLPVTVQQLGGLRLYGWAFSAFFLADVVGISVWGPQADRQGPARPYGAGLLLFGGGLVMGGLAPSMLVLVLGRAIQGFGAGALTSTLYVSIGIAYPEAAKAKMLAGLSSAWVVPGLVGPSIAGVVAVHVSWRAVFLGLVPILAVAGTMTLTALRQLPRAIAVPPDEPVRAGRFLLSLRLATGTGLLLAGLVSKVAWAAVPMVAVGGFVAVPALRSLLPDGTLKVRTGIPAAIVSRGALTFAFFTTEAFLPLALTSLRHLSVTIAGLCLTGAATSWATGSWIQARVGRRWSRRRSGRLGAALVVAGIAGTALVLLPAVPVVSAPIGWVVAGLGMGFAYQAGSLVVLEEAPTHRVGELTSALQLAELLCVAVGTGLGGALIAAVVAHGGTRRTGIALVDAMTLVIGVACGLACARLPSARAE